MKLWKFVSKGIGKIKLPLAIMASVGCALFLMIEVMQFGWFIDLIPASRPTFYNSYDAFSFDLIVFFLMMIPGIGIYGIGLLVYRACSSLEKFTGRLSR